MKNLERRFIANELRVKKSDDGGKKIGGYATKFAPFALSEDLGGWREQIHPNAFNKCLTANPDVRALWNHDANHVLGRTTAGTLRLSVDDQGLLYECDPPDTTLARDLMVSMERGDVTQSSFGFICVMDDWREDPLTGCFVRTVLEAELFDVSPVTFPAYPDATSGVRSMNEASQAKLAELRSQSEARKAEAVLRAAQQSAAEAAARVPAAPVEEERTEEAVPAENTNAAVPAAEIVVENRDVQCACLCEYCVAGDCDDCDNDDCEDEYCADCGMRAKRAAKEAEAAEVETLRLRLRLAEVRAKQV